MNLPKAHSDTYGYGPRQQMAYSPTMRWMMLKPCVEKNETIVWSVSYLSGFGRMNARRLSWILPTHQQVHTRGH